MSKDISRLISIITVLIACLLPALAQAELPPNNGSRSFDLKMQQYQNQRLWRPAAPATRQNVESRDYQRQLQLYDQDTRQRQDPVPPADSQVRHRRERQGLDLDLRLERAQDPKPPAPTAPHFDLLNQHYGH